MVRITYLSLLPVFIIATSHAAEVTIEKQPFSIVKEFPSIALPAGDSTLIKITPKSWTVFEILDIAAHGSKVAKGDVLVRFDPEAIDQWLTDAHTSFDTGTLGLAQAEQNFKLLTETAPNRLEAARRAAQLAKEDNSYFTQIRHKAAEESAAQSLKRSEQALSNQREELRQLTKMYADDDVTEDTEEIILTRQKDAVASAEFALRMETLNDKRTVEVTLPREGKNLADNERDTAIKLKGAEVDIPREIEIEKLKLEALKTAHDREGKKLAEIQSDRSQFEIKAPSNGWFYFGAIENGKWTTGDLLKMLTPRGHPPFNIAFATFVPSTAKLELVAFLDAATHQSLKIGSQGLAVLPGREDIELPVKLENLAAIPSPDGSYRADFSVTWSKEIDPITGAIANIRVIAYQQTAAICVPNKALEFGTDGWTVEVKLADGKTERRAVKRGRVSNEKTEILSGLDVGQVVVVP